MDAIPKYILSEMTPFVRKPVPQKAPVSKKAPATKKDKASKKAPAPQQDQSFEQPRKAPAPRQDQAPEQPPASQKVLVVKKAAPPPQAPAPAPQQAPIIKKAPVQQHGPAQSNNQAPVTQKAPVQQQGPVQSNNQAPVPQQAPALKKAPVLQQDPAPLITQAPVAQKAPVIKQAPVQHQGPVAQKAPIPQKAPVQQQQAPVAQKAPPPQKAPVPQKLQPEQPLPPQARKNERPRPAEPSPNLTLPNSPATTFFDPRHIKPLSNFYTIDSDVRKLVLLTSGFAPPHETIPYWCALHTPHPHTHKLNTLALLPLPLCNISTPTPTASFTLGHLLSAKLRSLHQPRHFTKIEYKLKTRAHDDDLRILKNAAWKRAMDNRAALLGVMNGLEIMAYRFTRSQEHVRYGVEMVFVGIEDHWVWDNLDYVVEKAGTEGWAKKLKPGFPEFFNDWLDEDGHVAPLSFCLDETTKDMLGSVVLMVLKFELWFGVKVFFRHLEKDDNEAYKTIKRHSRRYLRSLSVQSAQAQSQPAQNRA